MGLIKRLKGAVGPHLAPLGWPVASALLGSAIGLLMAALWVHAMGWR